MQGILVRWLILTGSIIVAAYVIDGIVVKGFFSAFFRPILIVLTLPINNLTLGLLTFVINAMLLKMASGVISGFEVHGFWSAIFGTKNLHWKFD